MVGFSAVLLLIVGFNLSKPQTITESIDWCSKTLDCMSLTTKSSYKNTMCIYDETTSKRSCTCMENSMTPEIKDVLLAMHNTFRNKIAKGDVEGWPSAADMRQLTWDDRLADSALRWAFQCTHGNDHCRSTPDFSNVGQNKGYMEDVRRYAEVWEIFSVWINEVSGVSSSILPRYKFDYKYHHFTNTVWGWTSKIGCGIINHTRISNIRARFAVVLVCNMAPGGNIKSVPIYLRGPPCSRCHRGTECNTNSTYQYLCALPTDPADEVPFDVAVDRDRGNSRHQPNPIRLILTWLGLIDVFIALN